MEMSGLFKWTEIHKGVKSESYNTLEKAIFND